MAERAQTLDYNHPTPGPSGKTILYLSLWVFMGLIGFGFIVLGTVMIAVWAKAQSTGHRDLHALGAMGLLMVGGAALVYFACANFRDAKSKAKVRTEL